MCSNAVKSTTAGIAQLVEHNLAKVDVASSSLVSRSIFSFYENFFFAFSKKFSYTPDLGDTHAKCVR